MAQAVAGTALVAGGAAVLNQVYERDTDALMRRTRMRPLPDGRVPPADARRLRPRCSRLAGLGCCSPRAPTCSRRSLAVATLVDLPGRLHADEAPLVARDAGRRGARRAAAAHRLDGGARHDLARRRGALRDRVPLADSALHGDRVDVSRRLRARRASRCCRSSSPTAGGRAGRPSLYAAALLPVSLVADAHRSERRRRISRSRSCSASRCSWLAVRFARSRTDASARALFFGSITYLPLLWIAMIWTN